MELGLQLWRRFLNKFSGQKAFRDNSYSKMLKICYISESVVLEGLWEK